MSEQGQPQNITQATGRVAEDIVSSFRGSPTLLLIVVLNIVGIMTAGYFLLRQDELQAENVKEIITLIKACILETAPIKQGGAQ